MALEMKFAEFKQKYDLSDEALEDVRIMFNEAFITVANSILSNKDSLKITPVDKESPKFDVETPKKKGGKEVEQVKKWATVKAEEHASENNLTLDDFPEEFGKVTKAMIEKLIKSRNGAPKFTKSANSKVKPEDSKISDAPEKKSKQICNKKCSGIRKDGSPCSKNGTENPEGSKNSYCYRCAIDWRNHEVSSDSSDEESEDYIDPNFVVPEFIIHERKFSEFAEFQ